MEYTKQQQQRDNQMQPRSSDESRRRRRRRDRDLIHAKCHSIEKGSRRQRERQERPDAQGNNNDSIPMSNCRWLAKSLDCCRSGLKKLVGLVGEASTTTTTTTRGESKVVRLVWI
jgi:hypothetical protein